MNAHRIVLLLTLAVACTEDADLEPQPGPAYILSPESGTVHDLWTPIRFDALGLPDERAPCCGATFRWTEGDDELGWGHTLLTDRLPLGVHEITLTVTDPDGSEWSDSVEVTVAFLTPLAFDEDGEIFVYDGDQTRAIATGTYPSFSPDGSQLLYVSGDGDEQEIVWVEADGSGARQLTSDGRYDTKPDWSPDGTQFAWVHEDDRGDREIWVADIDGGGARQATSMPLSADEPHWGLAGILYQDEGGDWEDRELYVISEPGDEPRQITSDALDDNDPHWFLDGRGVLASRIIDDNQDIYLMQPDGSDRVRLTDDPASDDEASVSPDGTKILFESDRSGVNELYVMRHDGSEVTRVPLPPAAGGRFHARWGGGRGDTVVDPRPGVVEAVDDTFVVAEGWVETMRVELNDLGDGPLEVIEVGDAANGDVALLADGAVQYIPDLGTLGSDVFTYVVSDGAGNTDEGTVTIDVVTAFSQSQVGYLGTPMLEVDGVYTHVFHESSSPPTVLALRESPDGVTWGPTLFPVPGTANYQSEGSLLTWTDPDTQQSVLGVSWVESDLTGSTFHRRFTRRVGATGSFSAPVQVSDHGPSGYVWGKVLSLGDGELLFVSNQSGPNPSEIRRNRSTDGGLTWTPEPTFGSTGFYGTVTSALADGDTVYVLTSADRYYKRNVELYISSDRGVTFGPAIDITGYTVDRDWFADFAALARAPDGTLHVVWEQQTPLDPSLRVFHTTSNDGGLTWASPFTQVSDPDVPSPTYHGEFDTKPRIGFGGGDRVYVFWADPREDNAPVALADKNHDLYYALSTDGGASWGADVRINDLPEEYYQRAPSFLVEPGATTDRIVVSWADNRYDTDGVDPRFNKLLYTELWAP